jgi:hypothetical protein
MIQTGKKKIFLWLLAIGLGILPGGSGQAQTREIFQGYYWVRTAGNIARDPQSGEMTPGADTLYMVLLQTNRPPLQWERAWRENKAYRVTLLAVSCQDVALWRKKSDPRNPLLKADSTLTCWRLELSLLEGQAGKNLRAGRILLQAKSGHRKIYKQVEGIIELLNPPAY